MPEYLHLPQQEDDNCAIGSSDSDDIDYVKKTCADCRSRRHQNQFLNRERLISYIIIGVINCFLTVTISFSIFLYVMSHNASSNPSFETALSASDKDCVERLSSYTPALNAIEYYETNLYDAFNRGDEYRGPPTADRDRAWHELWQYEAIMVESWAMPLLNRTNLGLYEKANAEVGNGYTAMLKMHHQLGCLDIIRQYTWLLAGEYPEDLIPVELQKPPKQNRMHVDRCIEDLRMSLMCQGDMTPLLITKEREEDSGFKAELNSHHKCRNFTALQQWSKSHGVEHWEKGGGFHQHGDRI